ncbi:MAG: SMP-30/gluconolactonase/LRE family protein [Planctomycetota bacterium]
MKPPEILAHEHCVCGENPLWDDRRGVVFWTDIPAGRIFRWERATGRHEMIYSGETVGGFTLEDDGRLLLFRVNDIALLNPDGRPEILARVETPDKKRFNDVIADPAGCIFAGTIGTGDGLGGLYRVGAGGVATRLFLGSRTANGMAFSPDRKLFYWTCSTTRRIFRFDYDAATGEIARRAVVVELPAGGDVPDGLTVDAEGCLWSARWNGYAVYRYSPEGKILGEIEFPVAKVSSVIFGGPDLDELYVTTAGGSPDKDTSEGALFRVRPGVRGMPEFRSKIQNPKSKI